MQSCQSISSMSEPGFPVFSLFIIENSRDVYRSWAHLRDNYFPALLRAIKESDPKSQPLTSFSCPVSDDKDLNESNHPMSMATSGLPHIPFYDQADNRISIRLLERGFQTIATTHPERPAARHVFVIAAANPLDEFGRELGAQDAPAIQRLIRIFTQKKVNCHMILQKGQNTNFFTTLFYEMLRVSLSQQTSPWFPVGDDMQVYLSAPLVPPGFSASIRQMPEAAPPLPRSLTYPPDGSSARVIVPGTNTSSRDETLLETNMVATASLVSRLQKKHGLSSKKKNGASHSPPRSSEFFTESPPPREKSTYPPPIAIPSPPRRSLTASEGMPLTSIGRRQHLHPTSPREAAAPYSRSRMPRTSPPGAQSELRPDGYMGDPTMSQVYMHTNGGWSTQRDRSNSRRGSATSSPIIPLLPFAADAGGVSGGGVGETDAGSVYSSMVMASSPHSSALSSRTPLPVYPSSSPEPASSDVYVSSPASMTSPTTTTISNTVPFGTSPPFPTASHLRQQQQPQPQPQAHPQPQQAYVPTPSALVAAPLSATSIFTSPTMIEAANQDPNQPFIFPENEPMPAVPVPHYMPTSTVATAAAAMTATANTSPGWPSNVQHHQPIVRSSMTAMGMSMSMTTGTGYINPGESYLESAIPRQVPPSFGASAMDSFALANGVMHPPTQSLAAAINMPQPSQTLASSLVAATQTGGRGTTIQQQQQHHQQQRRTAADDIPVYTGRLPRG